jgi:hypothetical protein
MSGSPSIPKLFFTPSRANWPAVKRKPVGRVQVNENNLPGTQVRRLVIVSMVYLSSEAVINDEVWLLFQVLQLVFHVLPVVCVGKCVFHAGDTGPVSAKIDVDLNKLDLIRGDVFFGINGVDWAFRNANCAIDAFVRVDYQEVWAFPEAIYGANIDTVSIFTLDARLCYYVGHGVVRRYLKNSVIVKHQRGFLWGIP